MNHDQLFKELLRVCFVDFLELFLPDVLRYTEVSSLEFIEQESFSEITARDRQSVDLLVRARFKGQLTCFLIHIEAQAQKQGWSGRRMFFYFAVQSYKHELPVYPIAIFSWDRPRRAEAGQYLVDFPDRRVLEFNFAVIQLNRLNWREYLRRDNAAASALMARMGVRPAERPQVRAACIGMLARLRLPKQKWHPIMRFIDAYLPLNPEQGKEFEREIEKFRPQERKVVMEYVTSWERKGMYLGKLDLTLKQLTRRFGPLTAAMRQRISKFSVSQLDDLGEALLDFQSKADFTRWIRGQATSERSGKHSLPQKTR